MILQRRILRPWINATDYTDYSDTPPLLEFENEEEMMKYVRKYFDQALIQNSDDGDVLMSNGLTIGWVDPE